MSVSARLVLLATVLLSGCASVVPLDTAVARFDPAAPRLSPQAYTQRVEQVTAYSPWDDPLPADRRVVIPGYASLHELSADQEAVVKAGLPSRFWTLVHWTNWRVIFPFPGWHQERVASQVMTELQAGHLVQL